MRLSTDAVCSHRHRWQLHCQDCRANSANFAERSQQSKGWSCLSFGAHSDELHGKHNSCYSPNSVILSVFGEHCSLSEVRSANAAYGRRSKTVDSTFRVAELALQSALCVG